jgi:hypothetical protein
LAQKETDREPTVITRRTRPVGVFVRFGQPDACSGRQINSGADLPTDIGLWLPRLDNAAFKDRGENI